jgi:Polyketide cyclase / dehydrase and lipid transport
MSETAQEVKDTVEEKVGSDGDGNGNGGGMARKLLVPAAAGIGTLAATVAARKGPDLFREKVMPRLEDKGSDEAAKLGKDAAAKMGGGKGGMLASVAGKALGGGGGGGGGGREKTRRLPIQRWTDVAVPVNEAYEKWTQFEEFPKFMHRVLNVEKKDDDHLQWTEKIWFSTRQWEGEITDRRKNDRIAWKTTKGTSHAGVVSFHKLDSNLTRVLVTVDFRPTGMIEKMGSGLRFVKRAVEADLARFKAYAEMGDAEGLEYKQPGEQQKDEKQEDKNGGDRAQSNGKSNGGGNEPQAGSKSDASSKSDEGREQSRQQRAERREERRGS